ncbi:zinc finger CCCH domain-containing protein 55-like [Panicum virgatum]|uniref:C3H1-type domain-containing protein n=1 Tax=Panicum virgatum TaxID=38727 RepID=A0A8T0V3S5_PANVG|nr:zinc finger CCCH domain-containing protein 55-like [Panicum virgatum]XP_039839203.1 zinc finger CCCH domain-containing protein 55-like [Panicum virgatum]XP_039839204.1 zinc finger CCCH domain-containing protein 55-like [Panicum virgatum]XP_039839205.1 zinc finger CCCH domain-containing protein 55-like [Panicum virgatum]XP_039839206.1 zinc finger CCCH domain-containing protein 55-like [Panicum virgatum]KAG2628885.1 hypothetical protein PVAP13_3KG563001 [Panicum virgatum]
MNRSVCKECPRSDTIEGSPESPWNQSHRSIIRSRSRSPERRWRDWVSEEPVLPFRHFAADRWGRAVPIPQRDYHFTLQGNDIGEGILYRGASWPYSHGVHSHEIRESSRARGHLDSSNDRRLKQRKAVPCKFYVQGQCHHGLNCRYLHDSALETEMGLCVPVAAPVHTSAHNWYPHHSAPQNQMELSTPVAVSASAHVLSGYGRGHLNSQGIFKTIAKDEHNGLQLNYAQRSQNYVFPSEDIVSQQPQLLIPGRSSENGIYIDKGQNSHETNGIVGVKNGMQAAHLATQKKLINQEQQIAWKNSGQIEQSQEAVHPIHEVPSHLLTTHLPNATASWPWNSRMHQSNFLVHPKRPGEFVVPQAGVNVPALSLQGQSFSQEAYAIPVPDASSDNGHSFNVNGQIPQNLGAAVHAGGSKEISGIPKNDQDSDAQSMQNTKNFQPVGVNMQSQRQNLQKVSDVPYSRSVGRVGGSIYHNTAVSEEAHIINPDLAPSTGKALLTPSPIGKRFSQRNRDPRLVSKSSSAPPSVPPIQQEAAAISVPSAAPPSVPPVQQEAAISVPSGKIHTSNITTRDDTTHPVVSLSVEVTEHAAARSNFKIALTNFVRQQIRKTWHSGHLTKEDYKSIVRNVVKKVIDKEKTIPDTSEKVDEYLRDFRGSIDRFIKDDFDHRNLTFIE